MAFKDKSGERHGRFVVLGISHRVPTKSGGVRAFWKCLCDCGTEFVVRGDGMGTNARSCGCLHRETAAQLQFKHGGTGTPEYSAWCDMKKRCLNQTDESFKDYGARGIKICSRWIDSFENFLADMGSRPSKTHSLDRIDNNGNYEPGNCKWSTDVQQIRNRRCTQRLECNGENYTIAEWSEKSGLDYDTIKCRIKSGWNPIDAVTKPSRNRNTI